MEYEVVVGLETHAELATVTKLFCGCSTKFGAEPNTQVCPVCLGMPGVLPVMNKKAFEYALKAAIALNCRIDEFTNFDRKSYYYPDLPKNYQISQNYYNLGVEGYMDINVNSVISRVRIHNVHLEEEAGKLIHPEEVDADYSLVDFNRAGVPLLEIVSYPDMRNVDEVESYMQTLRKILLYTGISDCKMQEGSLRFEASISLRKKGSDKLGNRVEIKNLNSMKSVLKAIEYEAKRQSEVLDRGETVDRETRLWDEVSEKSARMRSKEEAQDYRYFPEPDLLPVLIDEKWLSAIKVSIPELPLERKQRFMEVFKLSDYDASVLTEDKVLADFFDECVKIMDRPKAFCNWIINDLLREVKDRKLDIDNLPIKAKQLAGLVEIIEKGAISSTIAKEVFSEMIQTGKGPQTIIEEKKLAQISDEGLIEAVITKVISGNPDAIEDYKKGKKNALTFLVGQVMKETKGKANPKIVNEMLVKKVGI
ncbi:MAG: Asp-tRNA(Asn)/Glu-tRNA(Gln) amidotransferase subunit GatB [Candidatus Brocadia sp. AMX2]|uniref:Aspartyl/glutamyl-tRNA(Asn/Gln) amidotransferase subunit B n=1 Tax=Candidatus Brocadia sinica JPN1 TaxID=1197129 RepID=A0ABQ0K1M4_9BACT|nr:MULTISPECIES: Asp-tRNA(Asn)/Glu-tRNA(Gln) amidotransferase subunit GatB [Brocadia]KXK28798.1 MAG: aspartyl/glutamyl-tRNA amidotransferase subunit B [Candidatus Brocadia sinica]MBC6933940.1 Asp-tRNA(Asn)/Glu-tRNA(Gln) amidotransferase subunit GatB [Candidatus Brocadia sp.]MBL1170034.1 Asp-tRNA(Asn)/Glu-tRNA(Gln) amidotransferase subunit GatB [Candidatus Brocadia sp. AMX1]NOG42438.1 Asp-tRNA(Asn)/Glu-tRNA(Gln) amidotransferase subunit GatB [Planctomycetota bacterium]KAA0241688.1 MAG: Asp-tRNA